MRKGVPIYAWKTQKTSFFAYLFMRGNLGKPTPFCAKFTERTYLCVGSGFERY